MVTFPLLRTRRLTIQLRELSIAEAAAVLALPSHLEQAETTQILRYAVASVPQGEPDPAKWTLEERTMAICHYLAITSPAGPDFEIGEGHFSDYLDGGNDRDASAPVPLGEAIGDTWSIRALLGKHLESVERLLGEVTDPRGNPLPARLHWLAGAMAASLLREGENVPGDDAADGELDAWMLDRIRTFVALPEADFVTMLEVFTAGRERIAHLFRVGFQDTGAVFLPKEGAALPPARFPCLSCISQSARYLCA